MKSRRLAFDMDRVIVDTYQAQIDWLSQSHPEFVQQADGRLFGEFLPSSINQEFWQMLEDGTFFADLPPMEGAIETLEWLSNTHELIIVSAGPLIPNSCTPKLEWVRRFLPFFNPDNVVLCMNKSLIIADYLIDDQTKNLERFTGTGILYASNPSYADSDFPKVRNWEDIRNYNF